MLEDTEDKFEVGDFVFAKLKGHPHWPATISQIETHYVNGTIGLERTRYNVYFYGSHEMSMIKVDSILRFEEHYELFKRRYANNPKFSFALEELEADKVAREDYVKSLQDCLVDSSTFSQEIPDEMFSSSEGSSYDKNGATSVNAPSPTSSSGFGDSFDSDEEYQALLNQKYEILSMERVPYADSSEYLLVVSLGFKEEDLQEDFKAIREEIRMMTCFVKLERLCVIPKQRKRGPRGKYKKKAKHGCMEESLKRSKGFRRRKRGRRKKSEWSSTSNASPTVLAAEDVKRRRHQSKSTMFRDETRLSSLRQRTADTEEMSTDTETCVTKEPAVVTKVITCPICQAQFSSSVDYKQHSFNIHIMGL